MGAHAHLFIQHVLAHHLEDVLERHIAEVSVEESGQSLQVHGPADVTRTRTETEQAGAQDEHIQNWLDGARVLEKLWALFGCKTSIRGSRTRTNLLLLWKT